MKRPLAVFAGVIVAITLNGCLEQPSAHIPADLLVKTNKEAAMSAAREVRDQKYGLVALKEVNVAYTEKDWLWPNHVTFWHIPADLDLDLAKATDFVGLPFQGRLCKSSNLTYLRLVQDGHAYECRVVADDWNGEVPIIVIQLSPIGQSGR